MNQKYYAHSSSARVTCRCAAAAPPGTTTATSTCLIVDVADLAATAVELVSFAECAI